MLADLLVPLNVVLFRLGNDQLTTAGLLGFVTGGGKRVADRAAAITAGGRDARPVRPWSCGG
jgi:hypothetical protein